MSSREREAGKHSRRKQYVEIPVSSPQKRGDQYEWNIASSTKNAPKCTIKAYYP